MVVFEAEGEGHGVTAGDDDLDGSMSAVRGSCTWVWYSKAVPDTGVAAEPVASWAVLPVMAATLVDGLGVVAEPGTGVAVSLVVGVGSVLGDGSVLGYTDTGGLLVIGTDGVVVAGTVGVGVALPVFEVPGDLHLEDAGDVTDEPPDGPGELACLGNCDPEPASPDLPEPLPGPEC